MKKKIIIAHLEDQVKKLQRKVWARENQIHLLQKKLNKYEEKNGQKTSRSRP